MYVIFVLEIHWQYAHDLKPKQCSIALYWNYIWKNLNSMCGNDETILQAFWHLKQKIISNCIRLIHGSSIFYFEVWGQYLPVLLLILSRRDFFLLLLRTGEVQSNWWLCWGVGGFYTLTLSNFSYRKLLENCYSSLYNYRMSRSKTKYPEYCLSSSKIFESYPVQCSACLPTCLHN